jgi:hypothetical protein
VVPARPHAYEQRLVCWKSASTSRQTVIIGAGPGRTIVDGLNARRDVDIGFGSVVDLSGMTIRNGRFRRSDLPNRSFCIVPHTHGGGLHNHGVLTLRNMTFTGDSAPDCGAIASGTCPGTYDDER